LIPNVRLVGRKIMVKLDAGYWMPGTGYWLLDIGYGGPASKYPASRIQYLVSSIDFTSTFVV